MQPEARLAILGFPINHSASPAMQNAALRAMQLPFRYVALETKPEELARALKKLTELEFLGLNITLPHKQAVIAHLDSMSDHAAFLGAVNTIVIRNGKLFGHNTDGPGFVTALQETWKLSLAEQRVLILGATGGAGRAIAAQCLLEKCQALYLAGRDVNKLENELQSLSERVAKMIPTTSIKKIPITASTLNHNALASILPEVDLIVNATSLGMNKNDPSLIASTLFQKNHFLYDTIYSSGETALMQAASRAGAHVADGSSMLLHQGARAFELWFEQPAPLEVMRQSL